MNFRPNFNSLNFRSVKFCINRSFTTFRFGHTLVSSLIKIFKSLKSEEFVNESLDDHFFNTSLVRQGEAELVLLFHSLARQRAHQIDPTITDAVRNKLFRQILLRLESIKTKQTYCVIELFFICFDSEQIFVGALGTEAEALQNYHARQFTDTLNQNRTDFSGKKIHV